jgi:hypothetical protein
MKDLVQVIKDNPGCIATVDNDCWWIHKAPPKPVDEMTGEEYDDWQESGEIACDADVKPLGDGGYGSGSCYGGDILQALAQIVGIKIRSV